MTTARSQACDYLKLFGFGNNKVSYYRASDLQPVSRGDYDNLQLLGVSIGWDHVLACLADGANHMVYWTSDKLVKKLTTCLSSVCSVALVDRDITLLLTTSRNVIYLKGSSSNVVASNVTSIACCNVTISSNAVNSNMCCVLLQQGQLLFLKENHMIQHVRLPVLIQEVTCGHNHLLLLDTSGHVYSCGHGNRGQLCQGDTTNRTYPMVIDLTVAVTMIKISAGGWHSAMLSNCHDVYTSGWNCDGQLGHSDDIAIVTQPTLVATDDSVQFKLVSCGSRHTVAISNTNKLFTWGWNKYNQLPLPWQQDTVIINVQCGHWSTLLVTTSP
ncbi:E3 ISG15--protein ligase HERC5-like [Dysidea avara]|uniref:E3 ISG15--protein ligase HERC5-like n=1 Tax=Dysidea avara TaxID=196820 RepID=UPI003324F80C